MSYLLFSPPGFLKVIFKTYWMLYLLFSLQGFLRGYRRHIIPPHIFPLGFRGRLFDYDPQIMLLITKLVYDFSFSRFSHMSLWWDSNLYMSYHFLLFSHWVLRSFNGISIYILVSPQIFPTWFLEEFFHTIIKDDWTKITWSI